MDGYPIQFTTAVELVCVGRHGSSHAARWLAQFITSSDLDHGRSWLEGAATFLVAHSQDALTYASHEPLRYRFTCPICSLSLSVDAEVMDWPALLDLGARLGFLTLALLDECVRLASLADSGAHGTSHE